MIGSKEWFKAFVKSFSKNHNIKNAYNRDKIRGTGISSTEWTSMMSCFLSELAPEFASREGYYQEVELGTDFSWYEGKFLDPIVAIEHENNYGGVFKSEIPKLYTSSAPLKILITYAWASSKKAKDIEKVKKEIIEKTSDIHKQKVRKNEGEFLLALGMGEMINPQNCWEGYIFFPGGKYQKL